MYFDEKANRCGTELMLNNFFPILNNCIKRVAMYPLVQVFHFLFITWKYGKSLGRGGRGRGKWGGIRVLLYILGLALFL